MMFKWMRNDEHLKQYAEIDIPNLMKTLEVEVNKVPRNTKTEDQIIRSILGKMSLGEGIADVIDNHEDITKLILDDNMQAEEKLLKILDLSRGSWIDEGNSAEVQNLLADNIIKRVDEFEVVGHILQDEAIFNELMTSHK